MSVSELCGNHPIPIVVTPFLFFAVLFLDFSSMTGDPNSNDVNAVTVKLPQFYASNPEFWFVLCESQFRLRKVIDDFTKFDHVVTSLPEDVSTRAMAILRNPPMEGRYEALKQHLLREFSLSKTERAAKLLDLPGIGDMKPSQLLSKMNDLIPPGEEVTSSTFLFRELFLRQLPVDVRAHLMDKADLPLDSLALEADRFFSSSGQRIQAVRTEPTSSQQRPAAPTAAQHTTTRELCFFHTKYGSKARKCRAPCSFVPGN